MTEDWENRDLDDDDDGDDDAVELVHCPSCGDEIYEEAEQCPYCGEYVTRSTLPLAGRPLWFCALGLLGVAATVVYFLLR